MDPAAVQQLIAENQRLRAQVAQLLQTVRELQKRIEELERASKRQAAPFSKGPPKIDPKKPGRKSGELHGQHAHREPPEPERVDETLEAELPAQCPHCDGDIVEDRLDTQFQTEIPRRPIVRKFHVHCGHCAKCGAKLRGRHPLQTSGATGAARSQLGPDAQAAIAYLNKHAGLSHGKIADTFAKLFGITVTRGACAQVVLRVGRKLRPIYEKIKEKIKAAEHITPDETGWRIGGKPVWLHGWVAGEGTTCFVIDPRRGAEVLAETIGWDWSGTMTHDGYSAYDRFDASLHQQCNDHVLRRARALLEKQTGQAKRFPSKVIGLLTGALRTRDEFKAGTISAAQLAAAHDQRVTELLDLTEKPQAEARNETLAKHLYHHGEQWFEFLNDPTVPATNHRAEQALKTPIVNRKVWGGNRTEAGAEAQSVVSSVLQTCGKKAIDAFAYVSAACRGALGNLWP